ncbi:DUF6786 family protein [Thermophagus xiamenensis]|uniref:Methane oxygenase PmoA n=1 Tax=Thermophagus xiamenensis TaxID=385682 RepID=A0A1I1X3L8_9BACT|nr:DUF6786 family protein [Thermophagus xiamenensis]SFE02015.1 hypothetical protein SAMN05444380_105127 [Thermophagus xiamenensis]
MSYPKGTYGYDVDFLRNHVQIIELKKDDSKLVISPSLQGRVVTSSAEGPAGYSFGWVNYDLIQSGKFLPHCNNFGGEDRFWIGPEGGQFSFFFKKGSEFNLDNWQTPPCIDTESWNLVEASDTSVVLDKEIEMPNYAGHVFKMYAERVVRLLDSNRITDDLGVDLPDGVKSVCFKSENKLTNKGDFEWNKETGMPSIWILGQLFPSDRNTVIIPVNPEGEGPVVNDRYFGKIDDDRIKVLPHAVLFKGDGKKRGKIGIGPKRAVPVLGSFDPVNSTLTVVKYTFEPGLTDYINSMWEFQDDPFYGDVVNSYNDGPLPDGTIMGPFYELETSSAAANLKPGQTKIHEHATCHFKGELNVLEDLARKIFGVDPAEFFLF